MIAEIGLIVRAFADMKLGFKTLLAKHSVKLTIDGKEWIRVARRK